MAPLFHRAAIIRR